MQWEIVCHIRAALRLLLISPLQYLSDKLVSQHRTN